MGASGLVCTSLEKLAADPEVFLSSAQIQYRRRILDTRPRLSAQSPILQLASFKLLSIGRQNLSTAPCRERQKAPRTSLQIDPQRHR